MTALERRIGQSVTGRASLRILATTDLHMHILPYDYHAESAVENWGLTNTAKLIFQARQEQKNTVLLDNGDFLHGTVLGDIATEHQLAHRETANVSVHPMIAAMNHLGYDAATVGNHDFDRGTNVLLDVVGQAGFPFVSANAVAMLGAHPLTDTPFLPPYTIMTKEIVDRDGFTHDLRIGVIGFLPPGSIKCAPGRDAIPATRDIVETARSYVPQLRAQGADVVIALAHSGIGESDHIPGMENALLPLSRVDGIDAIIGGHTHKPFPGRPASNLDAREGVDQASGTLNGRPTVVPGFWGSHLGVIDLELEKQGARWTVKEHRVDLREVEQSRTRAPSGLHRKPADPAGFAHLLDALHKSTISHLQTPIGVTRGELDNYFALLGADSATRLVQEAMLEHAKTLREDLGLPDLPILASSAPFKTGGLGGANYYTSIAAGELTLRSISDLYIFPNEFALVRVNGAFMRVWLERSASIFNQVLPGDHRTPLKEDDTPGYFQESVLGLDYQIDLTQPARFTPTGAASGLAAGRIVGLSHQGHPVRDADEFLLATTDFRVFGGGGYPMVKAGNILNVPPISIREILRNHIETRPAVDASVRPFWTFAPVQGASVMVKSSPRALQVAPNYDWLSLSRLEAEDTSGFAYYEMAL